jgi:signal transduction histidine kinase
MAEDFSLFSLDLETAILRIVQERLTNVHRHSRGSTSKVSMKPCDGELYLRVEDDSTGITPEKLEVVSAAGMPGAGIRGMRERSGQRCSNWRKHGN